MRQRKTGRVLVHRGLVHPAQALFRLPATHPYEQRPILVVLIPNSYASTKNTVFTAELCNHPALCGVLK